MLALIPALSRFAYALPRKHTRIDVEPDRIRMFLDGGERDVVIGDVLGAHAESERALAFQLRNGTRIRLELEATPAADVLRAFGFDLDRRALTAPLRGTLGTFTRGALALIVAFFVAVPLATATLGAHVGPFVGAGLAVTLTALFVARFGKPVVIVGADGLRLTGGLRRRFVPFSAVKSVRPTSVSLPRGVDAQYIRDIPGWGVALELHDGESLHLPTIGQSDAQIGTLVSRIRAGLGEYHADTGRPLDELARNGRSVEQWKRELGAWQQRDAGFREQPVGPEELQRVLLDASAPLERRVGAALALKSAEPASHSRIRIAAETSANDAARAALEAVYNDTLNDEIAQRLDRG